MTEEEAHLKQCCGPDGCGRHNEEPYPARWCVGASCMAWRWLVPEMIFESTITQDSEPLPPADGNAWNLAGEKQVNHSSGAIWQGWERPDPDRAGFCGLAGKP